MKPKKIKKHKLVLEIEHDYFLIGIHSVLEDYRLAYFINSEFNINLKSVQKPLTFQNKQGEFLYYDYEDASNFCYWSLICNKQYTVQDAKEDQLSIFDEIYNTFILIPEKKTTDYFLKLEGDFNNDKIQQLTKQLNSIHRVMTTYAINPNNLKSKDFLIY